MRYLVEKGRGPPAAAAAAQEFPPTPVPGETRQKVIFRITLSLGSALQSSGLDLTPVTSGSPSGSLERCPGPHQPPAPPRWLHHPETLLGLRLSYLGVPWPGPQAGVATALWSLLVLSSQLPAAGAPFLDQENNFQFNILKSSFLN